MIPNFPIFFTFYCILHTVECMTASSFASFAIQMKTEVLIKRVVAKTSEASGSEKYSKLWKRRIFKRNGLHIQLC